MNIVSRLAALALAFAGASALALPVELGVGPGTYAFGGTKDRSYFVTLDPGTYTFVADVDVEGPMTLNDVWLSFGKDKHADGKNDLGEFDSLADGGFGGSLTVTLKRTRSVYIDVDTLLGKRSGGSFSGLLTIAAAVPEPASPALLLAGLAGLGLVARRQRPHPKVFS